MRSPGGVRVFSALLEVLPMLVLVAVITAVLWRVSPPRAAAPPQVVPKSDVFGPVRQTDPGFSPEAFGARVHAVYAVVQRARMVRQPNLARKWVTPVQLAGLEKEAGHARLFGIDRTVAPVRVTRMRATHVRSDGSAFFVNVQIVAETTRLGRRALTTDPLAGLLGQDDAPMEIDETWTFCRPIGALTAMQTVQPGRCAHCGAPVDDSSTTACPYCGQALRNADWLLSDIVPTDFLSAESALASQTSQTGAS
jgi:hypothetical protein